MIKTLKNLFKQDKEKFVVPKSVQAVIPIKTIWEDGVFLVGKNKYAKTFKFEDINYAVASREDKEAIGDRYGRVIFLREYAAYIKDSMVAELCELNRNMMLSVDVVPVPTDEAVREVENRLLGVETNITNWQRKQNQNNNFSAVIPYDLEQQRKESKEFLDDLTTRDQRMITDPNADVIIIDPEREYGELLQAQVERKGLCNQIYHTDCIELMAQIPDNYVSLILTDPPYGISYRNHFARQPHAVLTGDTGIDYERFARESYRILRENSHAYFFTRFDCYPYHYDCLKQAGFTVKNCLVVEKGTIGGIGDLTGSYANNAEWIIFCQKGRRTFQHTTLLENRKKEGMQYHAGRERSKKYKTRFNACWFGEEYPKATYNSVWQKQHQIYHPTIKNVECLSWLIQISSLQGELVFDGFMGTGSTVLAAIQTQRAYLGAEIDKAYFEIAQNRIKEVEKRNVTNYF